MEKRKIIIIDDEKLFIKMVKINLESTGNYKVETVSEPANVVSRIKSFDPDIILLDIVMPKIDGFEVCKTLSKDPAWRRVPIVVLSALDTDEARASMRELGVVDFLVKPIETHDIISKIEKVLSSK